MSPTSQEVGARLPVEAPSVEDGSELQRFRCSEKGIP
jgi:hypothetical protein